MLSTYGQSWAAGILIQGLGGVGKTTLARGFLQWLDQTGGLDNGCFWFSFQEIRSADFVFNRLGEALFGGNFPVLPIEQKIQALTGALRENRLLLVWDNFESATGIPGTAIEAKLPEADRNLLAQFLDELRAGATKVIITSRSPEDWLGPQRRYVLPLGGLDREERWEYCNAILRDLGKSINRKDKDLVQLMDFLGGHPQAMRAVLPRLEKLSAEQVLAALRSNLAALKLGGDDEARLYATLNLVEQSLPQELRPLLVLVGMHEGFVNANFLEAMGKQVDEAWTRAKIDALIQALIAAGLLREVGKYIYEMHPLLTSYVRTVSLLSVQADSRDRWARVFVDCLGVIADQLTPLQSNQRYGLYSLHSQNLHHALEEAKRLGMSTAIAALTQSLASFAEENTDYATAARFSERLVEHYKSHDDFKREAAACGRTGTIAQRRRDFAAAAQWHRRSLAISERLGDEHGVAKACHHLGTVAQEHRDFAISELWYRRALAINEKLGDEHGAANTYHQLGVVAEEQRNFAAAEHSYRRSLGIRERLGDEQGAAMTYYHLGRMAVERREFATAEQFLRKALAINEKLGNKESVAKNWHLLGIVSQEKGDLDAAEQRYHKSLSISERLGAQYYAALTYNQLGIVTQGKGDLNSAEQWYRKALAIFESLRDEYTVARTYGELGIVAALQKQYLASCEWLIKSILVLRRKQDSHRADRNLKNLLTSYNMAPQQDRVRMEAMWKEAGLGEFPSQGE